MERHTIGVSLFDPEYDALVKLAESKEWSLNKTSEKLIKLALEKKLLK